MKKATVLVLAVMFSILAVSAAAAQSGQSDGTDASRTIQRTLRVSGEASARVPADMAVLDFGIVLQAKTALAAKDAVTIAAARVNGALLALGIEREEIQTGNFDIQPLYDDRPGKQSVITGYTAAAGITVRLDDTSLVAKAVEAAIGAGANEVRSLEYGRKDSAALKLQTLSQAALQARTKAAALAEALGVTLGKPLQIEEQGFALRAYSLRGVDMKALDVQKAFAPGSVETSASVSILFEIR